MGVSAVQGAGFRVTPYLQNPSETAVTVIWFSETEQAGHLSLRSEEGIETQRLTSAPVRAQALAYHPAETPETNPGSIRKPPYLHQLRVQGLQPGSVYSFSVEQGGETASGQFNTPGHRKSPLRFIVFGDSETEPESVGKFAAWPGAGETDPGRKYLVDQETGYRANLEVIRERSPDFVAIAGDLVESGGEQRDWDEFWRLTAPLASGTFLMPALGNHEYFAGPGVLGQYRPEVSERAIDRYRAYFDLPANSPGRAAHRERYYAVNWNAVTLVVLDLNNGLPNRSSSDTNWYLPGDGEGGQAPDWKPGSEQHSWLEQTLEQAQHNSAFTFVMFHHCPYSSGVHGLPPGERDGEDRLSGYPLRALTPLFLRYGVDVVLSGHDEMYEHSLITGQEILPGGRSREHALHVYDVGIGGDGLRGPVPGSDNPYRVFLAHEDAPEIRDGQGVLVDGGKHYGHLEVNVTASESGAWEARLDMVYLFPVATEDGQYRFERRLYNDSTLLVSQPD
ncbi:MAG: metallophosphoesterase [Xanthomonadales bacterium]|nr:metallophosphoesterase [Xanthomonadales bacterium]